MERNGASVSLESDQGDWRVKLRQKTARCIARKRDNQARGKPMPDVNGEPRERDAGVLCPTGDRIRGI